MDETVKDIIRSWNWPLEATKFSERPNPFNISRKNQLNPSSVYEKWRYLFKSGYVKRLVLLPADSIAKRTTVVLTNVERSDFDAIISKMKDYYFLEKAQFFKIYNAGGNWAPLKKSGDIIILEFVNSSSERRFKQVKLVMNSVSRNYKILRIPRQIDFTSTSISNKLLTLTQRISYSDLSGLKLEKIASIFEVSRRTVTRWLDDLLKRGGISLFPVFNQSVMSEFNTSVAIYPDSEKMIRELNHYKKGKSDFLSEKYLFYRCTNGISRILFYYDYPEELDKMTNELASRNSDFALSYRYESYFNDFVEIGI